MEEDVNEDLFEDEEDEEEQERALFDTLSVRRVCVVPSSILMAY